MNPVQVLLGPVCGECVRKIHKEATGGCEVKLIEELQAILTLAECEAESRHSHATEGEEEAREAWEAQQEVDRGREAVETTERLLEAAQGLCRALVNVGISSTHVRAHWDALMETIKEAEAEA